MANASTDRRVLRDAEVALRRVAPDGSCWYSAAALALGNVPSERLRVEVAAFVARNPTHLVNGATLAEWVRWDSGLDARTYARKMFQQGAWAGGLENAVLAHLYKVAVEVWMRGGAGSWRRIARFESLALATSVVRLAYDRSRRHYDFLEVA